MAQAQEQQVVGLSAAQLQELLEKVVKAAKEPNESERAKMHQEQEALLGRVKQAAELAKTNEEATTRRRRNCAHHKMYNGRQFNGFGGQVCSDGMVHPVCKYCGSQWPPFSAKFLPDGGSGGVNMEEANPTAQQLTDLHRQSFPAGCEKSTCFICHPAKN